MKKAGKERNKTAVIVTGIALIVTMLSGTYAFNDFKQLRADEYYSSRIKHEARLVEDFVEIDNWLVGDGPIDKKISVVNRGREYENYGDVYVRIQLQERMEIRTDNSKETESSPISDKTEEYPYDVHSWRDGSASENETHESIEWGLNTDAIITVSEWLDEEGEYKGQPVDKWIIEDRNDSGWVYWGRPLATDGDKTELFMENVSLIKQPDGNFYYIIHTELESISFDELENVNWGEGDDVSLGFIRNAHLAAAEHK